MDPNATLAALRNDMSDYRNAETTVGEREQIADRIVELVEALDEWLGHGGFLPAAWDVSTPWDVRQSLVEQKD